MAAILDFKIAATIFKHVMSSLDYVGIGISTVSISVLVKKILASIRGAISGSPWNKIFVLCYCNYVPSFMRLGEDAQLIS